MQPNWKVEVFFDGDCPLCTKEIRLLRTMDRKRRIRFTDIATPTFDPASMGMTMDDFMERIHGRKRDGTWIEGVEVFRHLYDAVGLGPIVRLTRLPGVSQGLDLAYEKFAKNRLRWTGRCTPEGCELPSPQTSSNLSSHPPSAP